MQPAVFAQQKRYFPEKNANLRKIHGATQRNKNGMEIHLYGENFFVFSFGKKILDLKTKISKTKNQLGG